MSGNSETIEILELTIAGSSGQQGEITQFFEIEDSKASIIPASLEIGSGLLEEENYQSKTRKIS